MFTRRPYLPLTAIVNAGKRFVSSKLFVKGLPFTATEKQLYDALASYGEIKRVQMYRNQTFSRALVQFVDINAAMAIQDELNETLLELPEHPNMRYRVEIEFSHKEMAVPPYPRRDWKNGNRAANQPRAEEAMAVSPASEQAEVVASLDSPPIAGSSSVEK
jgi:RNA recognition motif-containing protein